MRYLLLFCLAIGLQAAPVGFRPHHYSVSVITNENLIRVAPTNSARFSGWDWGHISDSSPFSTNAPEGFYLVQNGSGSSGEFLSALVTNLLPGGTYILKITIDARSAGANGNVRLLGLGDKGSQITGPAGAPINFPAGASAVATYFSNVVVTNVAGPHTCVVAHATSPVGDWFRITELAILDPGTNLTRSAAHIALLGDRTTGYTAGSANNIDNAITNAADNIKNVIASGDMADVSNTNYATLNGNLKGVINARGGGFYTAMGNHDYDVNIANCTSYFGVPTYYTKTVGLVDFIFIDSNSNNPDSDRTSVASIQGSKMGRWAINAIQQSTNRWKVVSFHHAAWSSSSQHTNEINLRWDYKALGADVVLQAHEHQMERQTRDLLVLTDGLGGSSGGSFGTPTAESNFRSLADGWMKVYDSWDYLIIETYNTNNALIDRAKVVKR